LIPSLVSTFWFFDVLIFHLCELSLQCFSSSFNCASICCSSTSISILSFHKMIFLVLSSMFLDSEIGNFALNLRIFCLNLPDGDFNRKIQRFKMSPSFSFWINIRHFGI
jgi:hypothetical protein